MASALWTDDFFVGGATRKVVTHDMGAVRDSGQSLSACATACGTERRAVLHMHDTTLPVPEAARTTNLNEEPSRVACGAKGTSVATKR